LDPFNPQLDKGDADYDVRHRFVTSGVWDIPWAKDMDGWKRQALDGWTLTHIFTARTGFPFSIYDCSWALSGTNCPRMLQGGALNTNFAVAPDAQNTSDRYTYIDLTGQPIGAYTNAAESAVSLQVYGVPGSDFGPFPSNMTGRNAFRSPGYYELDG